MKVPVGKVWRKDILLGFITIWAEHCIKTYGNNTKNAVKKVVGRTKKKAIDFYIDDTVWWKKKQYQKQSF